MMLRYKLLKLEASVAAALRQACDTPDPETARRALHKVVEFDEQFMTHRVTHNEAEV